MSAFIVTDSHISAIVLTYLYHRATYGTERGLMTDEEETLKREAQSIGQMLVNENYRSVNARYRNEYGDPHEFRLNLRYLPKSRHQPVISPLALLKACDCYDYQACETDDYETTEAAKFIRDVRGAATPQLPGYDSLPYGIRD